MRLDPNVAFLVLVALAILGVISSAAAILSRNPALRAEGAPMKLAEPPQHVFLFSPRFVDLVATGLKTRRSAGPASGSSSPGIASRCGPGEVIPLAPGPPARGDLLGGLSVRIWDGRGRAAIEVAGVEPTPSEAERFARADGFADLGDFSRWRSASPAGVSPRVRCSRASSSDGRFKP